jgi:inner membrane protein
MDPVTQGVVGTLFAQAGARREQIRTAAAVGFVAGMAPDLDVLIRSADDPLLAIEYHRHFTHAFATVPFVALAVALIAWWPIQRWRPRVKFARVYAWSLLAAASHGLLDAATSYGTRLYWPFADTRVAWNAISVIDPLFTAPVALLLAAGVAMRSRRSIRIAAIWAAFYLAVGFVQQHRAEGVVHHWAEAQGIAAERVLAKPSFANLALWRGLVDDGSTLHAVAVRIVPGTQGIVWPGASVPHWDGADAPPDSTLAGDLARFRHFSGDWLFRFRDYEDGDLFIGDFRYAIDPASPRPLWGIRFDPDRPGEHVGFERPARVTEREREAFFDRLRGRDPGS